MRNIIIYIFFLSLSIAYLKAQNTDHKNALGYKLFVSDYLSLDKQYRQEVFARDSSYRFFHPESGSKLNIWAATDEEAMTIFESVLSGVKV
jgi:hypothetical protein